MHKQQDLTPRRGDAPASGKAPRTQSRTGLGADEARGASIGAGAPTPLSAHNADPAPPGATAHAFPGRARRNLILEWLLTRREPRADYLDRLLRRDLALSLSLDDIYAPAHKSTRLALTLFLDYCWHQQLEPAEVAALMEDARQDALDALSYVLGGTVADAA